MGRKVNRTCLQCGGSFEAEKRDVDRGYGRYCSRACAHIGTTTKTTRICPVCKAEYYVHPSDVARGFKLRCSSKCYGASKRKRVECSCVACGESFEAHPYHVNRGGGKFCSNKCRIAFKVGANSNGWKGGKTPRQERIRSCRGYSEWREAVFSRDNWTCQDCGMQSNLHAHHIFHFAEFEEHRMEVWNGITLCANCHAKQHPGRYISGADSIWKEQGDI